MCSRKQKKDVLKQLQKTKFPKNYSRKNVSNNINESFVLGDVNYRGQYFVGYKTRGESKYNKIFPELYVLLKNLIKSCHPSFEYTTIQVNKNVECIPHIDKNNVGPSYIISLGDYEGGKLCVEGKKYNIKNRWLFFDGTKGHWVEPFNGERYSIVYFTHTFKPPNRKLHNIKVSKEGIYTNGNLIKKY